MARQLLGPTFEAALTVKLTRTGDETSPDRATTTFVGFQAIERPGNASNSPTDLRAFSLPLATLSLGGSTTASSV